MKPEKDLFTPRQRKVGVVLLISWLVLLVLMIATSGNSHAQCIWCPPAGTPVVTPPVVTPPVVPVVTPPVVTPTPSASTPEAFNAGIFTTDTRKDKANLNVGVFTNCTTYNKQWCFGIATEAWGAAGSDAPLIGGELSIISEEPSNTKPKVILNLVWKAAIDGGKPTAGTNRNGVGIWFTSQPNTGIPTGIKFASGFFQPSPDAPDVKPAVIDVTETPNVWIIRGMCGTRMCGVRFTEAGGLVTEFIN